MYVDFDSSNGRRDAWGFGSVDPSSGTANLLETARVLGEMKKKGWRPRRTIVFCSWAAEEQGLMGSEEFVQENVHKLMARGVGVVNTDICTSGPIPWAASSPTLQDSVLRAVQNVPDWNGAGSLYDAWKNWLNQDKPSGETESPKIALPGSGSDHASFIYIAGIPVIDMTFNPDSKKDNISGSSYPTYHTGYETFDLVDKIIDPEYHITKACIQWSINMLFELADSMILPYNLKTFAEMMRTEMTKLQNGNTSIILERYDITLDHVSEAIDQFDEKVDDYVRYVNTLSERTDPNELRMINDQLMMLERVFILPEGLPMGRKKSRHAIYSPALFDSYAGAAFPGIGDLIHKIDELEGDELTQRVKELKRHVSDLMIVIQNAASFLKTFHHI